MIGGGITRGHRVSGSSVRAPQKLHCPGCNHEHGVVCAVVSVTRVPATIRQIAAGPITRTESEVRLCRLGRLTWNWRVWKCFHPLALVTQRGSKAVAKRGDCPLPPPSTRAWQARFLAEYLGMWTRVEAGGGATMNLKLVVSIITSQGPVSPASCSQSVAKRPKIGERQRSDEAGKSFSRVLPDLTFSINA